jgi:hypothetical protein
MTGRGLWRSVRDDLRRHWRHLGAGGLGIAVSIAALVFFLALGLGIRVVLLEEVFPLDRIEVQRRSTDLNLLALKIELGSDTLDDEAIVRLESLDGVVAVYPKMRLLVPAVASGGESLIGAGMQTELVADGIDPALVAHEVGDAFHDPVVDPADAGQPCASGDRCPPGTVCTGASSFRPGQCREEIPVIVSQHMVELYNGGFRRAYRLPKINPDALIGLGLDVSFGASSLRPSGARVHRHRAALVGYSDAAIPLGITMPLGFVRQLNRELGPRNADAGFHSAVVELGSPDVAADVIATIEDSGLVVRDGGARRAAFFTSMLLAAVALVGILVLTISAVHVMHVFALLVMIRRREIGVMRAVGASRWDVRWLIVAESAIVGLVAGIAGMTGAVVLARTADRALQTALPGFPFKPETVFSFDPWLLAAALALAVTACVLGALVPALRATAADPAVIVSGS